MVSQPRYIVLYFYSLGWIVFFVMAFTQQPLASLLVIVLIQIVNTLTVAWQPVRVSIRGGEIECYFPLTGKMKRIDLRATERCFEQNPIRIFSFSDFLVLRTLTTKVAIWRLGTKDFDGIIHALRADNT